MNPKWTGKLTKRLSLSSRPEQPAPAEPMFVVLRVDISVRYSIFHPSCRSLHASLPVAYLSPLQKSTRFGSDKEKNSSELEIAESKDILHEVIKSQIMKNQGTIFVQGGDSFEAYWASEHWAKASAAVFNSMVGFHHTS